MKKELIISTVTKHHRLFKALARVYNFLNFKNRIRSGKYQLDTGVVILKGLKIYSSGTNNRIEIDDFCRVRNTTVILPGSNNYVHFGPYSILNQVTICTENDGNTIEIGDHSIIAGEAELAAIEGTGIRIGEKCMFSSGLHARTGDSHSILDRNGKRTNPSRDIVIGNHVWIGTRVTCLKGTRIADDCIAAASATLSGNYNTPNCILGGVPAKVIKTDVNWCQQRIPMEEALP